MTCIDRNPGTLLLALGLAASAILSSGPVAAAGSPLPPESPLYAELGKKTGRKAKKPRKDADEKTTTANKTPRPRSKFRVGALGQIVMGPKEAPKPGIYGYGGSAGYRLSPMLEAEAGLSYFSYGLNYAEYETIVDVTDIGLNADAILLVPVSPIINLRGRGGAGMHNTKVTVSGALADQSGAKGESASSVAINLGAGFDLNFGSLYLAGEIRKPILMGKTKTMGGNLMQLTGEAGLRF